MAYRRTDITPEERAARRIRLGEHGRNLDSTEESTEDFVLECWEAGMTFPEIAHALGKHENTVKRWRNKAIERRDRSAGRAPV